MLSKITHLLGIFLVRYAKVALAGRKARNRSASSLPFYPEKVGEVRLQERRAFRLTYVGKAAATNFLGIPASLLLLPYKVGKEPKARQKRGEAREEVQIFCPV